MKTKIKKIFNHFVTLEWKDGQLMSITMLKITYRIFTLFLLIIVGCGVVTCNICVQKTITEDMRHFKKECERIPNARVKGRSCIRPRAEAFCLGGGGFYYHGQCWEVVNLHVDHDD